MRKAATFGVLIFSALTSCSSAQDTLGASSALPAEPLPRTESNQAGTSSAARALRSEPVPLEQPSVTRDRIDSLRARFLLRSKTPSVLGSSFSYTDSIGMGFGGSMGKRSARVSADHERNALLAPRASGDDLFFGSGSNGERPVRPVIGDGVVEQWKEDATHVRAVVPAAARRAVLRTASVALPLHANEAVTLEDDTTHVAIAFRLEGASHAAIDLAGGIARYADAIGGAEVLHRVHAEGTEDFVAFETRPEREELRYTVEVSRVAGLRLVSNTLEFLDEAGVPRLRVAPPYVVDATGTRHEAKIGVDGCHVDANPAAPWDRPVTKPGASTCRVHVRWKGATYPVLVDPAWTATGSMATARGLHTATRLASGKVLVAGGLMDNIGTQLASAELFDGTSSFAATGAMTTPRDRHTATLLPSGQVLFTGGMGAGAPVSSAELFDGTSSFAATGAMTVPRYIHTAILLPSGKVLVAGGPSPAAMQTAELFDGISTFTATGTMKEPHYFCTSTLLPSGKVLLVGSTSPTALIGAELFNGTSTFALTGRMTRLRDRHTATLLPSGKVLVTGGSGAGASSTLASAELFDGTSTFATTGAMSTPRYLHTATLLPSGEVLVAGGNDGNVGLSSTELFDGTSSFAAAGAMTTARWAHTATLLPSGKVLIVGGHSGSSPLSSAELFASAGSACASPTECASGFCSDGVCCNESCAGTCQACTAARRGGGADGVCGNAAADTDPRNDCSADTNYPASCGADGFCDGTGACRQHAKSGVSCRAPICTGNATSAFQCNSVGDCLQEAPVSCGAQLCVPGGGCVAEDAGVDSGAVPSPSRDSGAEGQDGGSADASPIPPAVDAGATCTIMRGGTNERFSLLWAVGLGAATLLLRRRAGRHLQSS